MNAIRKFSFRDLLSQLQRATARFPFTVFALIVIAALLVITNHNWVKDIRPGVWIFFSYTALLAVVTSLLYERNAGNMMRNLVQLGVILVLAVYALFVLPEKLAEIQYMQHFIFGFLVLLIFPVIAFLGKNKEVPFWEFAWQSIFRIGISYLFSGILMGGLSLAVLSLKMLFEIDVKDSIYADLGVFSFVIFGPLYFLTQLPEDPQSLKWTLPVSRFLKFIGLYILLPIMSLYLIILYVYLAKIVMDWELPRGWVSTLVSILGLGGMITLFINTPLRSERKSPVLEFFFRFFPLLLLPLLILMSIGIAKRVGDYGFTHNRLYVIILNAWMYVAAIQMLVTQSSRLRWIILSFSITGMIFTLGPLNVFTISKNSVNNCLIRDLETLKVWKTDHLDLASLEVIQNDSLREEVQSKLKYIKNFYGKEELMAYLPVNSTEKDLDRLSDFTWMNIETKGYIRNYYLDTDSVIDITGHTKACEISFAFAGKDTLIRGDLQIVKDSMQLSLIRNEQTVAVDMSGILNELIKLKKSNLTPAQATFEKEPYRFIIDRFNVNYDKENKVKFESCTLRVFMP